MKALSLIPLAIVACLGTTGFAQTPSQAKDLCLKWMTSDHCDCAAGRLSPKHLETYSRVMGASVEDDKEAATAIMIEAVGLDREKLNALNAAVQTVMKQCPGGVNPAVVIANRSEAIRRNPRDLNAVTARAEAYFDQGDYPRAIADFGAAIRLEPANPQFWNSRCWARAVWGRELDLALADCNESLRLLSGDSNTLDSRGFVHLRRGEFEAAIKDYDAAIKSAEPGSESASLYGRGLARLRMGQTANGRADINAATAQDSKVAAEFAGYGLAP